MIGQKQGHLLVIDSIVRIKFSLLEQTPAVGRRCRLL